MKGFITVFFGAGIGGALRHGINVASLALFGPGFPMGTLIINVLGSCAMGLLTGYFALHNDPGQHWRLFFTTGILGGFTTFSAFSLDTALLIERGQPGTAVGYVLLSVLLSIGALFAGMLLMRQLA